MTAVARKVDHRDRVSVLTSGLSICLLTTNFFACLETENLQSRYERSLGE